MVAILKSALHLLHVDLERVLRHLLYFFILLGHSAFGQDKYPFTKITFNYSKGHNSWNKPGIYSRSEYIEFVPINDNRVKLNRFYKVVYFVSKEDTKYYKDTTEFQTSQFGTINDQFVQDWLNQLNTQKDNYTEDFIKTWLNKPSKKEINQIARSINKELFFDIDFKEDRKLTIESIRNLDKIDSFLAFTQPEIQRNLEVFDAWNRLRIEIINNTDTTYYNYHFWSPLGQPINTYKNKDSSTSKNIINLEANIAARTFLPKISLTYKALDINNIKERYIKWYFEKYFK